jgi:hypothetical protein
MPAVLIILSVCSSYQLSAQYGATDKTDCHAGETRCETYCLDCRCFKRSPCNADKVDITRAACTNAYTGLRWSNILVLMIQCLMSFHTTVYISAGVFWAVSPSDQNWQYRSSANRNLDLNLYENLKFLTCGIDFLYHQFQSTNILLKITRNISG